MYRRASTWLRAKRDVWNTSTTSKRRSAASAISRWNSGRPAALRQPEWKSQYSRMISRPFSAANFAMACRCASGEEALALLLGRLAHVRSRAGWRRRVSHRRAVPPRRRAGSHDAATSRRTTVRSRVAVQRRAGAHVDHLAGSCRHGSLRERVLPDDGLLAERLSVWFSNVPFHEREAVLRDPAVHAPSARRHPATLPRWVPASPESTSNALLLLHCRILFGTLELIILRAFSARRGSRFLMRGEKRGQIRGEK